MADLTFGAEVVHDGNDAAITGGIKTYTDPNDSSRKGAVVALILADGTVLRAGQALAAASLPVVLPAAQIASLMAPVLGAGVAHIGEVSLDSAALAALETITVASVTAPLAAGTNNIGDVDVLTLPALVAGEAHVGAVGGHTSNPTSTLTRPANTTAYSQNDVISSNTTAGSVVVPSVTAARVAAGSFMVRRVRLTTNVTTGWSAASLAVRLWTAAPTYTNGDNGAYAVATGAAGYLGSFTVSLEQFADGASGQGSPAIGGDLGIKLPAGQLVYWDLQLVSTAGVTPISGQTFTLTLELYQD